MDDEDKLSYIDALLAGTTTQNLFAIRKPDGTFEYTRGRADRFHKYIIEEFAATGVTAEKPIAVFMGGGTASGKSSIVRDFVVPQVLSENPSIRSFVIVDCDLISKRLPEFEATKDVQKAAKLHDESKYVANQLLSLCIENRFSFIYDSTLAANPMDVTTLIHNLRANGYELQVVGVYCDLGVAIEREEKRGEETGRKVPLESILYTHKYFPPTFLAVENLFDNMFLYYNGVDGPEMIAQRIGQATIEIYQETPYNEFIERGALK